MTSVDRIKATLTLICGFMCVLALGFLTVFAAREGSPTELRAREIALREELLKRVVRIEIMVNEMVAKRMKEGL